MADLGYKAAAKIGTDSSEDEIGSVKSITVDNGRDEIDVTVFSTSGSPSAFRAFVMGLVGATVNITCVRDASDTAQDTMRAQAIAASPTAQSLLIDFDASSSFSADIDFPTVYVTGVSTSVNVDGVVEETYSIRPTGTFTVA